MNESSVEGIDGVLARRAKSLLRLFPNTNARARGATNNKGLLLLLWRHTRPLSSLPPAHAPTIESDGCNRIEREERRRLLSLARLSQGLRRERRSEKERRKEGGTPLSLCFFPLFPWSFYLSVSFKSSLFSFLLTSKERKRNDIFCMMMMVRKAYCTARHTTRVHSEERERQFRFRRRVLGSKNLYFLFRFVLVFLVFCHVLHRQLNSPK